MKVYAVYLTESPAPYANLYELFATKELAERFVADHKNYYPEDRFLIEDYEITDEVVRPQYAGVIFESGIGSKDDTFHTFYPVFFTPDVEESYEYFYQVFIPLEDDIESMKNKALEKFNAWRKANKQ